MKVFTVLEAPDGRSEHVAFVPEGFSWGALALTFLWAIWRRMWVIAALLFTLASVLTVAANLGVLGQGLAALLQFGVSLMFAFEARALQVVSLERAGYRRSGLIQASNVEAAELIYFASRARYAPNSAPSLRPAAHDDTLGIFGNV